MSKRSLFGCAAAVAVVAGVVVAGGQAGSHSLEPAHVGYPNSIAALGHSELTGFDSDPTRPGVDVPANSWATGTNPAVDSLYLRILSGNPRIRGRNVSLAIDGANVSNLLDETYLLAGLKPRLRPELVVIQIMDGDIRCDGTDPKNYAPFRATLLRAFHVIANTVPDARIFVISQLGRAGTLADALDDTPESRSKFTGTGPCDFFDPSGARNDQHIRYLDVVFDGYERQIVSVCRVFVHCRYGVMHGYVDRLEDLSPDLNHFAVSGLARIAELAWRETFDFTDRTPPVSRGSAARTSGTELLSLAATDASGRPGIEYKLVAPGRAAAKEPFRRYQAPVRLRKGWTILWRAVDLNGNSEATRGLRG